MPARSRRRKRIAAYKMPLGNWEGVSSAEARAGIPMLKELSILRETEYADYETIL